MGKNNGYIPFEMDFITSSVQFGPTIAMNPQFQPILSFLIDC